MKYKIICPNQKYKGISASVDFLNGIGYTEKDYLAKWFETHGYIVEKVKENKTPANDKTQKDNEKEMRKELVEKCKELGIKVGKDDTIEVLNEKVNFVLSNAGDADE